MINRPSQAKMVRLLSLLEDTVEFEEKSHGWERDRAFEADGGQVFYAVDTNIFAFYLEPFLRGPDEKFEDGKRRVQGYSQILRTDPPEVAGVIADAMSESIFFDRPQGYKEPRARHLLLLDGVQGEVFELLNAAMRRATNVQASAAKEASESNNRELLAELKGQDSDRKYQVVKEKLPHLFELFFSNSSTRDYLERLNRLGSQASVLHLGSASEIDVDKFPLRFLKLVTDSASDPKFQKRMGQIRDLVEIEFPDVRSKKVAAFHNDLDALAQLLALNEVLVPNGFKICLLTGAWSMFQALDGLQADSQGQVQTEKELRKEGDKETLATSKFCLRRPLSFWGSRTFKNSIRKSHNQVRDDFIDRWPSWVDPIVPKNLTLKDGVSIAELKEHAVRAARLGLDEAIVSKFLNDWDQFCSLLIPARAEITNKFSVEFEEVFSDLGGAFSTSVETLFDSCAWVGLLVSSSAPQTFPSRLTPNIIFDCSEAAQKAVDAVERALYPKGRTSSLTGFSKAMIDLRETDTTGYFFNIGVAMMFANERQYEASRIYASRAINIAQAMSNEASDENQISGREAYFLLSSIVRLKARNVEDIDLASNLMRLAKNRLVQDRRQQDIGVSSIRFDCEDVARETAKIMIRKHIRHQAPQAEEVKSLFARIRTLFGADYEAKEKALRDKLQLRLSINALSIALIFNGERQNWLSEEDIRGELDFHLERAQSKSKVVRGGTDQGTYLHQTTILAAKSAFGESGNQPVTREEVEELFSKENIERHSVTSYDKHRFTELRDICLTKTA